MIKIAANIIPILLLIAIGWYFRYKELMDESTIDEIKSLVVNVSLASVLFITFLNMELKDEYFLVFFMIFILLCILFFIGLLINKIKPMNHALIPFIITGCSFGLLGIPLFGTVFGIENIEKLSILGVGHEFFIWIIFYPFMGFRFKNERFSIRKIVEIIKSPFIISIFLGIIFNVIGLGIKIQNNLITSGFYTTLEYLASLATPLILIIIGYGLKFDVKYIKQGMKFVAARIIIMLIVGYIFKYLVIDHIIVSDKIFDYAYFTFLILPPPLSLSVFVGVYSTKEYEELINNTVVLNTIVSIFIFIVFAFMI